LTRAHEVIAAELRNIRKTLQRNHLVDVRFDELGDLLPLPAGEVATKAGFVVDHHEVLTPDCSDSIAPRPGAAKPVQQKGRLSTPLL
jgi:hypothetical protein